MCRENIKEEVNSWGNILAAAFIIPMVVIINSLAIMAVFGMIVECIRLWNSL